MVHIIAYTFDADFHCVACTLAHVRQNIDRDVDEVFFDAQMGIGLVMKDGEINSSPDLYDGENNELHPVFSTDETAPEGEWCGDCLENIVEPYEA